MERLLTLGFALLACNYCTYTVGALSCQAKDHLLLKLVTSKMTWDAARKHCQSTSKDGFKGDLIVDTSNLTNKFIHETVGKFWLT